MRSAKNLTKALRAYPNAFAGCDPQQGACSINAAARLYSSATSSAHLMQSSIFDRSHGSGQRTPHFAFPQQQLTSLLYPQARSFSSGEDNDTLSSSTDFAGSAADSTSNFGPSAILNAVAGVEEDGWLAAREDVWFFNRYMQSVLRFAQDATGLPWYSTIQPTEKHINLQILHGHQCNFFLQVGNNCNHHFSVQNTHHSLSYTVCQKYLQHDGELSKRTAHNIPCKHFSAKTHWLACRKPDLK